MAGTMRAGNNLACVHQFVEGGPQAGVVVIDLPN